MSREVHGESLTVAVLDDGNAAVSALVQETGLPVTVDNDEADFLLYFDKQQRLHLRETVSGISITAAFDQGRLAYRRNQSIGAEHLVRAAGGLRHAGRSILDATAGLGRDAMLLATAGFPVTMVERNVIVHCLLKNALEQALSSDDASLRCAAALMQLLSGDAETCLASTRADIVVLDPMFPPRRKSAGVRKEMRLLGRLLADDDRGDRLLQPALAAANERVIVKRPRLAPCLDGQKPDWQITGRSGRFDVYAARVSR